MRGLLVLARVAVRLALARSASGADEQALLLATTTDVQDSGLLEALLPEFEEPSGIRTRFVAVGGAAQPWRWARGATPTSC